MSHREVLLEVTDEVMAFVLTKAAALPDGSVVTGMVYDFLRRRLLVRIEHASFSPVREGMEPPHVPVERAP